MTKDTLTKTELEQHLEQKRQLFKQNTYPSYQQRIKDLKVLKHILLNNQAQFIAAISDDFSYRCEDDSRIGDILTTVMGINYTLKQLKKWMKPEKRHVSALLQPAKANIIYQPKGVVGIIVPWNYPVFLSLGPLTAALAAGNVAMIKMSEFTPNTNTLLEKLIQNSPLNNKVSIICGDASVAANFSSLTFDHLFYTGSTTVGKLVMKAAAENLVPVTLELGGKSPAIIDTKIDIELAVSRFILGKTMNAGQTCVAPDYVFCPQSKIDQLVEALKKQYQAMYPDKHCFKDNTCIVTDAQQARINKLLDDAQDKGATLIPLGEAYQASYHHGKRQMPLTLLLNTHEDMLVRQEEIFGPLLPIIGYSMIDEAIEYINRKPRPLALYLYSFDKKLQQDILLQTHAGGVCLNDANMHVSNDDLPFGGIGASGMGSYHGIEGFKTFTHAKSVFARGRISFASMLFPPFGSKIHQWIYKLYIK